MAIRDMATEIDNLAAGATHIGFICSDVGGHLLLKSPKSNKYGVTATWPRVRLEKKETCSDALQRCIDKGIGYDECSVYPIPSLWVTSNSATYYFAGYTLQRGASEAAPESAWFPRNQIKQLLSSSNNAMSRHRDLGVLAAVNKLCLSPLRRIFLMVNELHQLGFELTFPPLYVPRAK